MNYCDETPSRARDAARQKLLLAVADFRAHAALFLPLLPPTFTRPFRTQD
jgi:hypothetical protein